MKAIRRVLIALAAGFGGPIFLLGFVWHVSATWFSFGVDSAKLAEKEWVEE